MPRDKNTVSWLYKHLLHDGNECLIWPFHETHGYPRVRIGYRMVGAHRQMLILAKGPAPFIGAEARHSCAVKLCVNPKHLFWGTKSDNMRDHHRGFKEKHS